MVMNDVSARRRCCAEAQARGVRGGGSPPGTIDDFPQLYAFLVALGRGIFVCRIAVLWGEHLNHCRAGIYPPAFFSLHPVHSFPPGDAGRGRRGNNDNDNDTMACLMGPVPSIAARGFR